MNVLITGNMGYVGPSVGRFFREQMPDANIKGLDIGLFAHCLTGVNTFPESRVYNQQIFKDVRSITEEDLHGIDVIVHLAAVSNDPMGNAFEEVTLEINHQASVNVAKLAKKAGVKKFLFASSCSVYGSGGDEDKTESSELNPLTAYAKSKINTEVDLEKIADKDFNVTCLRFATACGASERLRLDLVLNDFVTNALLFNNIEVLSDGSPWRPLINVKDMARALYWASKHKNSENFLSLNVGLENFRIKELAQAVGETLGNVKVSINEKAMPDKRSYRVNFDKFRSLADDFLPQTNLTETIKDLASLIEPLNIQKDFRNSNLIRFTILADHIENRRLNKKLEWL